MKKRKGKKKKKEKILEVDHQMRVDRRIDGRNGPGQFVETIYILSNSKLIHL